MLICCTGNISCYYNFIYITIIIIIVLLNIFVEKCILFPAFFWLAQNNSIYLKTPQILWSKVREKGSQRSASHDSNLEHSKHNGVVLMCYPRSNCLSIRKKSYWPKLLNSSVFDQNRFSGINDVAVQQMWAYFQLNEWLKVQKCITKY